MIAPCYHLVSETPAPHIRHLFPSRTVAGFERELDWLLSRLRPITLDQICASRATGERLPKRALFLSFDDGFREMAEIVSPLCKRKGVPATFFLTTDFLDNRKLGYRHKASLLLEHFQGMPAASVTALVSKVAANWSLQFKGEVKPFILSLDWGQTGCLDELARAAGLDFDQYLSEQQPYLTSTQVNLLLQDGFSIGAHSLDHPRYSEIPLEEQIRQTHRSMEFLDLHFGLKNRAFAFPFVSDGVGHQFYDRVFSEGICDLVFCIGDIPHYWKWPVIERFGVERAGEEPIWTILQEIRRRRWRSRIGRMVLPFRHLLPFERRKFASAHP